MVGATGGVPLGSVAGLIPLMAYVDGLTDELIAASYQ